MLALKKTIHKAKIRILFDQDPEMWLIWDIVKQTYGYLSYSAQTVLINRVTWFLEGLKLNPTLSLAFNQGYVEKEVIKFVKTQG